VEELELFSEVVVVGAGNAALTAALAAAEASAHVLVLEKASAEERGGNSRFYHNDPSGAGLMLGAVFGRRAGTEAAAYAQHTSE
jgi:succinate dehydrogenase/fumarate reductase flavoprotein subunit